jgi:hypothetical protein
MLSFLFPLFPSPQPVKRETSAPEEGGSEETAGKKEKKKERLRTSRQEKEKYFFETHTRQRRAMIGYELKILGEGCVFWLRVNLPGARE